MLLAGIIVRVQSVLDQLGTTCTMEELVNLCPELTWNQAFLAIDYLSREGQVCVMLDVDRGYRVRTSRAVTVAASSSSPPPL